MQQLKQLIKSRIKDIKQIQETNFINIPAQKSPPSPSLSPAHSSHKFQIILKQRNGEEYRNSRQIIMLSIANGCGMNCTFQQLENVVFQICSTYQSALQIDVGEGNAKERLYQMLRGFFSRNGFKEKLGLLKGVFSGRSCDMTVGVIFTLLSEWSKKQYLQALSSQIKQVKSRYLGQNITHSPSTSKLCSTIQVAPRLNYQKSISSITMQMSSAGKQQPQQDQQKPCSIIPSSSTNPKTNLNSLGNANIKILNGNPNNNISSSNRIGSVGSINSAKILTIYNRVTLYGYLIEELDHYYQVTGIQGLDRNWLKTVPKKKMKENLLFVQNINRAAEVLIQCTNNKQQRAKIKAYTQSYKLYKQAQAIAKAKKSNSLANQHPLPCLSYRIDINDSSNKKNIRTLSDSLTQKDRNSNNEVHKKFSIDLKKDRLNERQEGELVKNMSSALLGGDDKSETILNSIRDSIKKKLIYKTIDRNEPKNTQKHIYIKFPSLSRSMQKKQKSSKVEKVKLYRFPTEEQQQLKGGESSQKQKKVQQQRLQLFKFGQRQIIKGIIIKNFLSNRQKQKNRKNQHQSQLNRLSIRNRQEQNSARKLMLQIENEEEESWKEKDKEVEKRSLEHVDIRSLRQKTKALLKNYKIMQKY